MTLKKSPQLKSRSALCGMHDACTHVQNSIQLGPVMRSCQIRDYQVSVSLCFECSPSQSAVQSGRVCCVFGFDVLGPTLPGCRVTYYYVSGGLRAKQEEEYTRKKEGTRRARESGTVRAASLQQQPSEPTKSRSGPIMPRGRRAQCLSIKIIQIV